MAEDNHIDVVHGEPSISASKEVLSEEEQRLRERLRAKLERRRGSHSATGASEDLGTSPHSEKEGGGDRPPEKDQSPSDSHDNKNGRHRNGNNQHDPSSDERKPSLETGAGGGSVVSSHSGQSDHANSDRRRRRRRHHQQDRGDHHRRHHDGNNGRDRRHAHHRNGGGERDSDRSRALRPDRHHAPGDQRRLPPPDFGGGPRGGPHHPYRPPHHGGPSFRHGHPGPRDPYYEGHSGHFAPVPYDPRAPYPPHPHHHPWNGGDDPEAGGRGRSRYRRDEQDGVIMDDFGRRIRRRSNSPSPPPTSERSASTHSRGRSRSSLCRRRGRSRSRSSSRSRSRSRSPSTGSRSHRRGDDDDEEVAHHNVSRSGGRHRPGRSRRAAPARGRRRRSPSYSSASSRSRSSSSSDSGSNSSSSSSSSSSDSDRSMEEEFESDLEKEEKGIVKAGDQAAMNEYTKDQRTVFVSQLVMRANERDVKKFLKKHELKVNEVILLRDKRTGHHKGSAYVELRQMPDVAKAVALSGQVPDFQRFPILIKVSEAEKNYVASSSQATVTAAQMMMHDGGTSSRLSPNQPLPLPQVPLPKQPPMIGPNGKLLEAQRVYVGSLDPSVSQQQLFALFSQFGQLEKVSLQMDPSIGISKGFAFLAFRDPKEANLAIQSMSNQVLAGRPMKTGWANQVASHAGVEIVTSEEFPADATTRTQRAYQVLAQLTLGVSVPTITGAALTTPGTGAASTAGSRIPTVAEARASLAAAAVAGNHRTNASLASVAAVPHASATFAGSTTTTGTSTADPNQIGNSDRPTQNVLVHNMFDKDKETEPGWEKDIRDEFVEECSRYGRILSVIVMHQEPGGKIYASFDTLQGAKNCASSLAGRWFDMRQLRVEFVSDRDLPRQA